MAPVRLDKAILAGEKHSFRDSRVIVDGIEANLEVVVGIATDNEDSSSKDPPVLVHIAL
jgi:hypothetical protein